MVDATCNGRDWTQHPGKLMSVDAATQLPPLRPTYPKACPTEEMRRACDWIVNIFSHTVNLTHHLLDGELDLQHVQITSGKTLVATAMDGDVTVVIHDVQSRSRQWREWTTLTFEFSEIRIDTPVLLNWFQVARGGGPCPGRRRVHDDAAPRSRGAAFALQARGFATALAGGEPPRAPVRECLQDVRVTQRMIEIVGLG